MWAPETTLPSPGPSSHVGRTRPSAAQVPHGPMKKQWPVTALSPQKCYELHWVQANFSTNSQEGSPVLGQRAETTPLSAAQLLSQ